MMKKRIPTVVFLLALQNNINIAFVCIETFFKIKRGVGMKIWFFTVPYHFR